MTIVGRFRVSAELFAIEETLQRVPDAVIEIERVVATGDVLTPYFWVTECDLEEFEAAAEADGSIEDLRHLDTYERAAFYRADWTDRSEAINFAYTSVDAIIVEATGQYDEWELRIRFDDDDRVREFNEYCRENDIDYVLEHLYDEEGDRRGARFGLTDKQAAVLMTAWEMGYFEEPRRSTLADVGAELGVAKQTAARRLRRAHQTWIGDALEVTPPGEQ